MRILLFTILINCFAINAQESFGTILSNYVPTQKMMINPASMSDSKVWLDIQIIGLGTYVNNNMLYIKNQNTIQFLNKDKRNIAEEDIGFNKKPNKYNVYTRTYVQLLSAVWTQGNHGVGFSIGARSFTAGRKIPEFVPDFIESGSEEDAFYIDRQFDLKNIRVASNNYAQVQLSYSNIFRKDHRNMFTGGIALKKFLALAGAAGTIYEAGLYIKPDSIVRIDRFQTDGLLSTYPNLSLKGGWAFDIGFSYQKMLRECSSYYPNTKRMGCVYMPYKYKIAASIIDFGYVKFNPKYSQFAGYEFEGYTYSYAGARVTEESAVSTFEDFESSVNEGKVKNNYKIATPAMLSIQGDYNVYASKIYAYGAINQGIPIGKRTFGTRRANSLVLAARFESRLFDVAIPFSLYEYTRPQIGLSFRLYCLTIGTDKFLSYWGARNYYGTDIYFSLNIPIFYYPACAAKMRNGSGFYNSKRRFGGKHRKRSVSNCDAF